MNNNEQNYSEISVGPETMQNMPESASPSFAQDAEGEAARAATVGEMMVLVKAMGESRTLDGEKMKWFDPA
jgi:hypothetical protein